MLSTHRSEIERRFGVKTLAVFGSVARDEANSESDLDVLVVFAGPTRFDPFMRLKAYLENLVGTRVDLVTPKSMRPELRSQIEREALYVA